MEQLNWQFGGQIGWPIWWEKFMGKFVIKLCVQIGCRIWWNNLVRNLVEEGWKIWWQYNTIQYNLVEHFKGKFGDYLGAKYVETLSGESLPPYHLITCWSLPVSGYRLRTRHKEALAVGDSFAHQDGPIAPQVSFCCQIWPLSNKNTGLSLINEAVSLINQWWKSVV